MEGDNIQMIKAVPQWFDRFICLLLFITPCFLKTKYYLLIFMAQPIINIRVILGPIREPKFPRLFANVTIVRIGLNIIEISPPKIHIILFQMGAQEEDNCS